VSDRLKDLQRQRALAQEQIAWLDREIAREMGAVPAPQPAAIPVVPAPSPASAAVDADADKIMAQYRSEQPIRNQVKQGCLVYFFAAFALVGIAVVLLYIFHERH
jgi:hypothetical protein